MKIKFLNYRKKHTENVEFAFFLIKSYSLEEPEGCFSCYDNLLSYWEKLKLKLKLIIVICICTVIENVSVISESTVDFFFLLKPITLLGFYTRNRCNNSPFCSWSTFRTSVMPNHWTCIQPSCAFQHTPHGFLTLRMEWSENRRILELCCCYKRCQKVLCVWKGVWLWWSLVQTSLLIQHLQTLAETVWVTEGLERAQRRLWLKRRGSVNVLSECFGMFFLFTVM